MYVEDGGHESAKAHPREAVSSQLAPRAQTPNCGVAGGSKVGHDSDACDYCI